MYLARQAMIVSILASGTIMEVCVVFAVMRKKQVHISTERADIPLDYETYYDINTLNQATDYLKNIEKDRPFFAVVDFQNPHNICSYIGNYQKEHQVQEVKGLPSLPQNFETDDLKNRPFIYSVHVLRSS